MKITCVSDLHGYLPEIPDCDLLLIAGDICPATNHRVGFQQQWLDTKFRAWLKTAPPVVAVAGNHDFCLQAGGFPDLPWTYLQDSGCEIDGLKIHGSPWQPEFGGWAFNAKERELEARWEQIPPDTDILLLHGPPYGYGDLTDDGGRVGSCSLTRRIHAIQPRLVVYGHIHNSYGRYQLGRSILVNAAYVDESYFPANPIQVIEL